MNLEKALELVLNEAESSALGEGNQMVLDACEIVETFYTDHGYHFANYTSEEAGHIPSII